MSGAWHQTCPKRTGGLGARLAGDAPVLRAHTLDDDLDVLLRGTARLVQRVRERLDHLRNGLFRYPVLVELDLDQRHCSSLLPFYRSTCWAPLSVRTACSIPRLITAQSPTPSVRVSPSTVRISSPSVTTITCSVCSCKCVPTPN